MNTIEKKLVPVVDIVEQFNASDEGKSLFLELRKKKQNDPARFNRQYSPKLIQEHLAAEASFGCAMHRFIALNEMRSEWVGDIQNYDNSDFDKFYEEYHDYVLAAARHVQAYRAHRRALDMAIIKQDKQRKRQRRSLTGIA